MSLAPDRFGATGGVELMAVHLSGGLETPLFLTQGTLSLKCKRFGCSKRSGAGSGVAFPMQSHVSTALFL